MNKIERELVYNKYNGRCAYCGCKLDYKDMQVDHIVPIFRNVNEERPYGLERGNESVENSNPSCRACNKRKGVLSVEEFRAELEKCHERMLRDNPNYRQLVRYGQIKLVDNGRVKFYFEK